MEEMNMVCGGGGGMTLAVKTRKKRRQHCENTTLHLGLRLRTGIRKKHTFKWGSLIMQLGHKPWVWTLLKYIPFAGHIGLDTRPCFIHRHAYTSAKLQKKKLLITICRASKTIKCLWLPFCFLKTQNQRINISVQPSEQNAFWGRMLWIHSAL